MLSDDQIRLVSSMLILIPLSYLLRYIPSTFARIAYSNVIGIALQVWVYREGIIGIYIQSIIAFILIKLFKGKNVGKIVTIESMIFLSGYHIHQVLYNYGGWSMSAEALMMILVCKYSFLAYSVEDGCKDQSKLTPEQKLYRVTEDISLWNYFGFLNFLPSSLIGPPLEYRQYSNYINQITPFTANTLPSSISQTLKSVGQALICASLYLFGQIYIPIDQMKTQEIYISNSAFYVLMYSAVSVTLIRFKYYFGWKLIVAAVHASGVSYSQQSGKFNAINSCAVITVQTDLHMRNKISHWNITVQQWLRKVIYQRSPFKSRGASQLWVFMVSAFWHGFYPGYYYSFFLWFVQVYTQGQIFRLIGKNDQLTVRKIYKGLGVVGAVVLTCIVNITFSHNASLFIIMEHKYCMQMLHKVYFLPQVALVTLGVVFTMMNNSNAKRQRNQTKKVASEPSTATTVKDDKTASKDL